MLKIVPGFEELLSTIEIVSRPEKDGSDYVPIELASLTEGESMRFVSTQYLRFNANAITPGAASTIILRALQAAKHPVGEDTAFNLMFFLKLTRGAVNAKLINELLSAIRRTDVQQTFVFPTPADEPVPGGLTFNLSPFTVQSTDREKLIYNAKRVGCDFFKRYPSAFRGSLSIKREPYSINLVPLTAMGLRDLADLALSNALANLYFDDVSRVINDEFVQSFANRYRPYAVFQNTILNLDQEIIARGGTFINIFDRREDPKWAFFHPSGRALQFRMAPISEVLHSLQALTDAKPYLRNFDPARAPAELELFLHFVSTAENEFTRGNNVYGLLNYVIALEVLFGEGKEIGKSVASRTAAAVVLQTGAPFKDAEKLAKSLYDARSKFVHSGEQNFKMDKDKATSLMRSSVELALITFAPGRREDLSSFRALLDVAANSFRADLPVAEELLTRLGLKTG